MTRVSNTTDFGKFLERFELIELPVSIHSDAQFEVNRDTYPLPEAMLMHFIAPIEDFEPDEFTEATPAFRFPVSHDAFAIIYWIACLHKQCFVLATYNRLGEFVDRTELAGTWLHGREVTQAVARIEEDFFIFKSFGKATDDQNWLGNPENVSSVNLHILDTGHIQTI